MQTISYSSTLCLVNICESCTKIRPCSSPHPSNNHENHHRLPSQDTLCNPQTQPSVTITTSVFPPWRAPYGGFSSLGHSALFWSIWANPQTKVHEILKYLLMMCDSASLTWSAHIKLLFQQYRLPDPLTLLSSQPWTKERWRVLNKTAVTAYHEVAYENSGHFVSCHLHNSSGMCLPLARTNNQSGPLLLLSSEMLG